MNVVNVKREGGALGSPARCNGSEFSVIVPVRNRSDLLRNCLASLRARDIDSRLYDVIICDDGSTEDLESVVAQFRNTGLSVVLLRQPAKGPAAARNLGARHSRTPYVICVDSDVVCAPGFLECMMTAIRGHPEWMAAQASIVPTGASSSPLWDAPRNNGQQGFISAAAVYRREALIEAGGFDEVFPFAACEDGELAARLLKLGKFGFVPDAIAHHPCRKVTFGTYWRRRKYWKYEMILAKRCGFLSFPGGKKVGPFPRLRVALAAVVTLPLGHFREGVQYMKQHLSEGVIACFHAVFEVFCGLCALPEILFAYVPERRNYLSGVTSQ